MSSELLPCPFCGSNATHVSTEQQERIDCDLCGCAMSGITGASLVAKWNTRAAPAPVAVPEPVKDAALALIEESEAKTKYVQRLLMRIPSNWPTGAVDRMRAALASPAAPEPVAVTDAWSVLAAMPVCPIPDDAVVGDFVMLRCGQTRQIAVIPKTVPTIGLDGSQDPKWICRSGEALSPNCPGNECVGFKRAVLTPGKDQP